MTHFLSGFCGFFHKLQLFGLSHCLLRRMAQIFRGVFGTEEWHVGMPDLYICILFSLLQMQSGKTVIVETVESCNLL